MGDITTTTDVCGSVGRSDPAATFSTTATASLKGVAPTDHVTVADDVARDWPGLLTTYQAGSAWTVTVAWETHARAPRATSPSTPTAHPWPLEP